MREMTCPHRNKAFTPEQAGYTAVAKQVPEGAVEARGLSSPAASDRRQGTRGV